MTCKTRTVSMNIDSRGWVWLLVAGPVRLTLPLMMVDHCHGNLRTRPLLHHRHHLLHHQRRTEYRVWALPLASPKLGGGAPVSYHPTIFFLLLILVRSFFFWWIKVWFDPFFFESLLSDLSLWSCASYIIKFSLSFSFLYFHVAK